MGRSSSRKRSRLNQQIWVNSVGLRRWNHECMSNVFLSPERRFYSRLQLEMEVPKILWLKNNMEPSLFRKCQFFDLPDFLTYQATKDSARSCCSITCKCSYVPKTGWQKDFFKQIGLEELVERDYAQIGVPDGEEVLIAGMPVGEGLSSNAADELGLLPGTPVGSALIDA